MESTINKILTVFGTRPEAIKLAPIVKQLENIGTEIDSRVCVTAQHREMLDQVLEFFNIRPYYDLNLMKPDQSLYQLTANCISSLEDIFVDFCPDLVIVQGDTTTTFASSLCAYYSRSKIAHVEAGLRSYNRYSPYPEELNRVITGKLADYHFAPTVKAENNLRSEGINDNVWTVGNTVIDALFTGLELLDEEFRNNFLDKYNYLDFDKKLILVTSHRRESFGKPMENIMNALREIAEEHSDIQIVFPVHLNPNVKDIAYDVLDNRDNVYLIEPVSYPELILLMDYCYLVLTDSGGIQEEAPSLGKPVLVMRDVTERTEGIDAGTAKLVGSQKETIKKEVSSLIYDENLYSSMSLAKNPYGDGTTSAQILKILGLAR